MGKSVSLYNKECVIAAINNDIGIEIMATSKEFIDYVVAQVSTAGVVETKRMFGEYGLYLDGKCVALVCDDTVFVKILPELSTLMAEAETGFPYPRAKEHYVLSVEHRQHAIVVLQTLAPLLPFPKPRKKKAKTE